MEIKEKIKLRRKCNFLLENVISLSLSLNPELRYIQNLWVLNVIDTKYIQNESLHVLDRFNEEPYDTIIRILPKIINLINSTNKVKVTDKIKRLNICEGLEDLNLAKLDENKQLIRI